ncbi:MAG TPA: GNAT family N-acetyltransferase [Gaiellaceae bacterium]|nr:GNAT family N-acetyltransferase [Gaiellaceae bacterium]
MILATERLRLRPFREEDRDVVACWNADPVFTRHLAGVQTRAQSDAAFDRWQRHWDEHGFGLLAVEWAATGDVLGRSGPQYHRAWPDDPEVGWALDPAWWGRGIATEAGAASIAWVFGELDFARVVSITTEANIASRRVMAKLGLVLHERVDSEWGALWIHALDRG